MSNLTFDWGGVTKDFLGHTLDPVADLNIGLVVLLVDSSRSRCSRRS